MRTGYRFGTRRALPLARRVQAMTFTGIRGSSQVRDVAPAITLAQLIEVLSQLTDDENEIVGTLLHMVERRSVRLIAGGTATAL
jgi:hypothetical protein